MNRFAYSVFYQYDGPSLAAPLRSEKSEQEVVDALARVTVELPYYLSDEHARISETSIEGKQRSVVVTVITILSETETADAMAKCLKGLDLYGRQLHRD